MSRNLFLFLLVLPVLAHAQQEPKLKILGNMIVLLPGSQVTLHVLNFKKLAQTETPKAPGCFAI